MNNHQNVIEQSFKLGEECIRAYVEESGGNSLKIYIHFLNNFKNNPEALNSFNNGIESGKKIYQLE